MKQLFKWLGICIGGIILIFILATIALYFFLPRKSIKDFAEKELTARTNHRVKIKDVSLSIFKGIKLKELKIGNPKGFSSSPLFFANSVNLKYAFWPLLTRKIIVHEIAFEKPVLLLEKNKRGSYNYDDIFRPVKPAAGTLPQKEVPLDLIVNNISIKGGRILFRDHKGGKNEIKNIGFKLSGITLALVAPLAVDLSAMAIYQKQEIPFAFTSKVSLDVKKSLLDFMDPCLTLGPDTLTGTAKVTGLNKNSKIDLALGAKQFRLDPLLSLLLAPQADQKTLPKDLKIALKLNLEQASLKNLKFDRLNLDLALSNRALSLKTKDAKGYGGNLGLKGSFDLLASTYKIKNFSGNGINSAVFLNDLIESFLPVFLDLKGRVDSKLDFQFSGEGKGIGAQKAFENFKAAGYVMLSEGRIKSPKSLQAIADQYHAPLLRQDLFARGLKADLFLSKKILTVKSLALEDTDMKLTFAGGLDFGTQQYVAGNRLSIKFSPNLAQSLPADLAIFKNQAGFADFTLELKGPLSKPQPSPILNKPIEKVFGNLKIKVEAKKIEIDSDAKEDEEEADQPKLPLAPIDTSKNKIKEINKF